MTKAELLKAIETLPDETEIYIVDYDGYLDNSDEWRLNNVLVIRNMTRSPIIFLRC